MIFTTRYTKEDGSIWEGERIKALTWAEAEYKAAQLGLTVDGRLNVEIDEETGVRIDYDIIKNN